VLYSKNSSNAFRRRRRREANPANCGSAAPMTISSFCEQCSQAKFYQILLFGGKFFYDYEIILFPK